MDPIWLRAALTIVMSLLLTACGDAEGTGDGASGGRTGEILIDGSSTVFPVTQLAAERFGESNRGVRVSVGISGTGGGFEKFCNGETDISDASRPIKDEEAAACAAAGIGFIEMPVAFDGIAIVVNRENDFAECLTTEQLHRMWGREAERTVTHWDDVNPVYPDREIELYGPDPDSGTFDYFTDEINGGEGVSRRDYTPSTDDNVLVQGVAGGKGAVGYFGFAYYVQNRDKLRLVAVDGGGGCVLPSNETIEDGSYNPLSRPVFIYVSTAALAKPEVAAFVRYYNEHGAEIAADPNVGYTALPDDRYEENLRALEEASP
jgi:phosphate transport system substrate-binding protein